METRRYCDAWPLSRPMPHGGSICMNGDRAAEKLSSSAIRGDTEEISRQGRFLLRRGNPRQNQAQKKISCLIDTTQRARRSKQYHNAKCQLISPRHARIHHVYISPVIVPRFSRQSTALRVRTMAIEDSMSAREPVSNSSSNDLKTARRDQPRE